jgi:aryl-alcohol dehydrogenase-like predicted oxidoreductase
MRTIDDLVRSGKVRHVGLSNVPAWYAARAQTVAEWRGYEPLATLQLEYSLAERAIENEFVPLCLEHGMGLMTWSPLASGLLSGKYRPSETGSDEEGTSGEGRLTTVAGIDNPAFKKFTVRNWKIVAALEAVAKELGRPMAQVAVNWAANRPGIASVIIGATKLAQLQGSLAALSFTLPSELKNRLDTASAPDQPFPHEFFGPQIQAMINGGVTVEAKPGSY